MINMVDPSVWETHRKQLTPAESKCPALQLFGIFANGCAIHPLPLHYHKNCMEICFLTKGVQTYQVGGTFYGLSGSDIFVTYQNEPHSTGNYPQGVFSLIWMQINLEPEVPFFGLEEAHARQLRQELSALPRIFSGDQALQDMLTNAFFALADPDPHKNQFGQYLLLCGLSRLTLLSRGQHPRQSGAIGEAIAYIHEHCADPILLENLAEISGLSLSGFKATFKANAGVTPRDYINRVRIEASKKMLREGMSVTEAAMRLSFATPNYFSTTFRRYEGISPSQYILQSQAGNTAPPT